MFFYYFRNSYLLKRRENKPAIPTNKIAKLEGSGTEAGSKSKFNAPALPKLIFILSMEPSNVFPQAEPVLIDMPRTFSLL